MALESQLDLICRHEGAASHNVDTNNRIRNAVKYRTGVYRGLSSGVLYRLGGQAAQFSHNSVADCGVSDANASVKLGLTYILTNDADYATFGAGCH